MHRSQLPIAEPCSADWGAMSGDEQQRFCGQCSKHVHDLSAMTAPQAQTLVQSESDLCVRYKADAAGNVVHRRSRRGRLRAAVGALLVASSPALASSVPAESPDDAPSLAERVARRVLEWVTPEPEPEALVGKVAAEPPVQVKGGLSAGEAWHGDLPVEEPKPELVPPPEEIRMRMGSVAPRVPAPAVVDPTPVPVRDLPQPAEGQTVIPEVQQVLDDQAR